MLVHLFRSSRFSLRKFLLTWLTPALFSAAVTAQELENLIVTGTYQPIAIAEFTSVPVVLERSDLDRLQVANVQDALRTVAGVLVSQEGGAGGVVNVSLRGGEANFTTVLIDGVAVNDPTNSRGGSFDFSSLNIQAVERIEIVKGPQSVIYGSDSLSGVINIITRRPSAGHRQTVNAGVGEHGEYHGGVRAAGAVDQWGYSLAVQNRDSGEQVPGSEYQGSELNLRLDYTLSADTSFYGGGRYVDSDKSSYPEQSGGPQFAASDALDETSSDDTSLYLVASHKFNQSLNSSLQADWFRHQANFNSPGIDGNFNVPANYADNDYENSKLHWVNTLAATDRLTINTGIDTRFEQGDSRGALDFGVLIPTDYTLDRDTYSGFVDTSYRIAGSGAVQASMRYDDPDNSSAETTHRLGVRLPAGAALTVFGNWGEGFKLPSFSALGHPLVGNPDLKPETVTNIDLGIQWQAAASVSTTVTVFSADYKDLIDFDADSFRNVNRAKVTSDGAELQADWQATEALTLSAHASYTDLNIVDSSAQLLQRPEWQAGMVANYVINARWSVNGIYNWTDHVYAATQYTGDSLVLKLDDFHRFDINVQWQATEQLNVALVVDNLLDENYQEAVGFPAAESTARLNAILDF